MEHLQDRLSKWQVMALSRELHHDEAGVGKLCDLMLYAEDAQSAYNAAWILYYLPAEDKRVYVSPFYDKIADWAMKPCLHIRRGLVLSILIDLSSRTSGRTCLIFVLPMLSTKRNRTAVAR